MTILLIEYRTPHFAGWKEVFDRDPMDRAGHAVARHCGSIRTRMTPITSC
jgi:hypothetical protein